MRKFLLIFLLISSLTSQCLSQDIFVPLDEDFNTWIDKSTSNENDLYVFSPKSNIGYRNADFRISRWNGLFWTQLPTILATNVFYGSSNKLSVDFHNNQLIVAGSFYANNESIKGICTWNGATWEPLGSGIHSNRKIHDEFSINDLASFKDELFVCGDFNIADDLPVSNLVRYSNGKWVDIKTEEGKFDDLTIVEDTLYVSGSFEAIEGESCNNLAAFYTDKWHAVIHPFNSPILQTGVHNNTLVAVTKDGFYIKNGTIFNPITSNLSVVNIDDMLTHNGVLFASGLFINSANDSLRLIAISNSLVSVYLKDNEVQSPINNKILLSQLNDEIYLTGSFQKLKGIPFKHSAKFKPGTSILKGQVYIDNNTNCVFDSGDEVKQNAIVSLNNGAYYTSTNENGFYSLFIENNQTSTIEIFPADNEQPICNGAERTVRTTNSDSVLTEHFALKLNKQETPVKLSLTSPSGYQVKHGYTGNYILSCFTADASKYPISVSLRFDKRLTKFKSSLHPIKTTNNSATWKLTKNQVIELEFRITPSSIFMDDELQFTSEAQLTNRNETVSYDLNQTVVSAYDPNDKQCDKYELTTTEKKLEYLVRFQNLGNDHARNIHIVDTIDKTLPIEFIRVLKNSHYEKYSTDYRVRGHAIVWSFKNIELPPKNLVGNDSSSGFIAYQCNLDKSLTIGQEITNTAYIYFDFQPPVITNTTHSIVSKKGEPVITQSEDFVLFPNPTNGMVNLRSNRYLISKLAVYSTNGKKVYSTKLTSPSLDSSLVLNHLPAGVYFVKVGHLYGNETLPIVIY